MVEYNRFTVGNWTIQEQVTTANFVIYLVELVICFFMIFVNFMFTVVMLRTELLHRNLRIILFGTAISDIIYGVSRYLITVPLIIAHLFNVEISTVTYCWAAKSLHHFVAGIPSFVFFIVILERSIASYFYKNYETNHRYQIGYWLAGLQWSIGLFIVTINQIDVAGTPRPYSRLPCQMEYTTAKGLFITIALYLVLTGIGIFIFYKMVKFNKKLYKQRSWKLRTLSETFQVSENVKSIKILVPLLIVSLISNLFSTFLVGLQATVYLLVRETPEDQRAELTKEISIRFLGRGSEASQSYDITAAISKILLCVYTIRSHPILLKKWRQTFWSQKIEPEEEEMLKLTVREETEQHFDSLKLIWEERHSLIMRN